ncbi:cytochrome b-c1 complex subunit 1, mitochondrial isoform X2 [Hemicordylus capensis]|uniref:cytochrome b-c1 complex subunit 1, mitochondrial isoform X2 n=1 Tax=Hemicordylus capensis TaxID=884348 RepID=UPI002302B7BB|nr:cytochrome b-c1 complex subunit 1, mitochondrial isoform X2 [Hemicordylus capensis]
MAASSVCRAAGCVTSRVLLRGSHSTPALWSLTRRGSTASYAQVLHNLPETQVTALDNGFRIASEHSGQPTCTVGVWISAGSRYENGKNNGAGNFVEHLAFKGTKKRPGAAFEKEVESMGAHLNGYTSREQTAFFMKALSKDLPKAVEILADVVQNCSLEDSQIEKERSVILQEMKEIDSSLPDVIFDYLHATAYQGTPLSQTVEGTSTNTKQLTRADIVEYIETHYKAPRMVLAAAGGVDHKELVDLAKQHFGSVPHEYKQDAVPLLSHCRFTGSEIQVRDDALPLAHVAIAVEGPGWANPDNIPLLVANAVIGNFDITFGGGKNQSSRLATIAVENKLCQNFQAFNTCYSDTGLFGFYYVTDAMNIEDTLHFAQGEWMRLCSSVTDSEVKIAKNRLRSTLAAQLDGTTPVCETIGSHLLNYGRRIPLAEWDARISEVDARTVREVCNKYLYDRCPAVAAVGPIEQLPDYNRIRSAMYWLRL